MVEAPGGSSWPNMEHRVMPGHADASTTEIYTHYAPDPTHGTAFAQRAFGDRGGLPVGAGEASRLPGL